MQPCGAGARSARERQGQGGGAAQATADVALTAKVGIAHNGLNEFVLAAH